MANMHVFTYSLTLSGAPNNLEMHIKIYFAQPGGAWCSYQAGAVMVARAARATDQAGTP